MSKTQTPTLDEAIKAIRKLPEHEQTIVAADMLAIAQEGALPPIRSAEDQAIIEERMNRPRTHVSREAFEALMRKFNPAL